jgi:hypothetical protein
MRRGRQARRGGRTLGATAALLVTAPLVLAGVAGCGGGPARAPARAPADAARHPCQLVTKAEASSILRTAVLEPHEAPLGPTCILEAKSGAVLATVALENISFDQLRSRVSGLVTAPEAGRSTYCGTLGQPTLWAPLAAGNVLVITAPCPQAQALASAALARLP